jgi:hemoglobin/transferrin/lactoferrin receptor protein
MTVSAHRLFASLLLVSLTTAQESDHPFTLDPVVVTPSGRSQPLFETPYSAETIAVEELERQSYRSVPQVLRDIPGVLVQETAHGNGSPYIRGFTGFRNLFLIDGIRLNNSVFRDGPNQYWNTVDPFLIERLEVVKGPSSVLYGSDAIGGTVQAITRSPYGYGAEPSFAGELVQRFATAENYSIGRAEVSATNGSNIGLLVGMSLKHFGDLRGGKDIGRQPNTGYDEWSGDVKLEHFFGDHTRLVVAHQSLHQDDVPRTHKTIFAQSFEGTTVGSDRQRDLDQDRQLTYMQLHTEGLDGWFDGSTTSLSWHNQMEERDRIKGSGARELQGFDVGTLGFFQHFHSDTSLGRMSYGVEFYHDRVDSFLNKLGAQTAADDIQGPIADDATYDLLGVFLQDQIELSERWNAVVGARVQYAAVDADSVRDPVTDAPIALDDDWATVVGSVRLTYEAADDTNVFGGISQGFRAPNLSDLTRFDSARSNEFEIASPGLDPEFTVSYEVGVKIENERAATQASFFYTDIQDAITRVPTGGTNADGDFEIMKANVGDGFVAGVELGSAYELDEEWTLFGNATWMEGKAETYATSAPVISEEYLDRLMPLTTQLGLRWENESRTLWSEGLVIHAEKADKLSTRDKADTERIPPGGTPAYTVLDLRGGWQATEDITWTVGFENITNADYRIHGSGQNRPGANLIVGLRVSF